MPIYQRDVVAKTPNATDCKNCGQGVAVTTEKLCGICDGSEKITNAQNSNEIEVSFSKRNKSFLMIVSGLFFLLVAIATVATGYTIFKNM